MPSDDFSPGQRWISSTEPELGLGLVLELDGRNVVLAFPAAEDERAYARNNAPLSRLLLRPGDIMRLDDGSELTVTGIEFDRGCALYTGTDAKGETLRIPETRLSAELELGSPRERLLAGQIESPARFRLRRDARSYQAKLQRSGIQGLLGPRVQLLPHQLYIASEVASRQAPRVLLADEVGLGKTIEAGLIIHQQLMSGRAQRVLICVPDSLVHQWLVELLRRFNLAFSVLNEERCEATPDENAFEATQWNLCSLDWLCQQPRRLDEALQCDWDLLVVDEAHHLHWSPEAISPEYAAVEQLATVSRGLLLLTATPEQLGNDGHFARLRLLDPARFTNPEAFREQQAGYQPLRELITALQAADTVQLKTGKPLQEQALSQFVGDTRESLATELAAGNTEPVIRALLDFHGTGRVLFRNTRGSVGGFPERRLHVHELPAPDNATGRISETDLARPDLWLGEDWTSLDPRVGWLIDWLQQNRQEKLLVIGTPAPVAEQLETFLALRRGIRCAAFHEHMSLVERDRAAAWFADKEQGAQLLLCSEIGSEGRNFQFAQHLVLFDLPRHPDLLEQRIGRLDRIGQQGTVHIHVPAISHSATGRLLEWYDRGIDAFSAPFPAGEALYQAFSSDLDEALGGNVDDDSWESLLQRTAAQAAEQRQALENGRDALIELHSHHPREAEQLIEAINASEESTALSGFMEGLCDEFGVDAEPGGPDITILRPGESMDEPLPGIPDEGLSLTTDRDTALSREDLAFLTWEHPLVSGIFDRVLNTEFGSTTLVSLKLKALPPGSVVLEVLFKPTVAAPAGLGCARYLESDYIRICLDNKGRDLGKALLAKHLDQLGQKVPKRSARDIINHARPLLEPLLSRAGKQADALLPDLISAARQQAENIAGKELARLKTLAEVNPGVRADELAAAEQRYQELLAALGRLQLVPDAIRVALISD